MTDSTRVTKLGFWKTFEDLRSRPEADYPHLSNVDIMDAIKISRTYSLAEFGAKGVRYAGNTDTMSYIVCPGEYGCIYIVSDQGGVPFVMATPAYVLTREWSHLQTEAFDLFRRLIVNNIQVSSLIQWFDSVYRRSTGRKVSPNFFPEQNFEKLKGNLTPGLEVLEAVHFPTPRKLTVTVTHKGTGMTLNPN